MESLSLRLPFGYGSHVVARIEFEILQLTLAVSLIEARQRNTGEACAGAQDCEEGIAWAGVDFAAVNGVKYPFDKFVAGHAHSSLAPTGLLSGTDYTRFGVLWIEAWMGRAWLEKYK
jgi:hypothetical protein